MGPQPADDASLRHRRRRSSVSSIASVTDTLIAKAKHLESEVEKAFLLLWDDLPDWRRDNSFIYSGYRPSTSSFTDCFTSLGYLHNESVNIYSHLLGAVAFLSGAAFLYSVVAPRYDTASAADVLVFACFFGGAICCLGMSATFHAISSHSEAVARVGNKLDYSGIIFLIVGSYVPALYYGFYCDPTLMTLYLGIMILLGLGCGAVSWVDRFRTPAWRPWRAGMFVALGTSGVVPVLHALSMYEFQQIEERMSLSLVILHGLMYIFGAVLYAARWPERSFPGKFDIWGSSHQLFHMFVLMAAATHLYAMAKAFDHHHTVMGKQCL